MNIVLNVEIFGDALKKYRQELGTYLNEVLETETDPSIRTDEYLIKLALEEAAERLRMRNEKRRKGWKRTNDGQQDHKRSKQGDIIK